MVPPLKSIMKKRKSYSLREVNLYKIAFQAWRSIFDHSLRYSHWWAAAGIFGILLHDNPSPFILAGGGGLFVYFLFKQKALAFSFLIVFVLLFVDALLQTRPPSLPLNQTQWEGVVQSIPDIDGDVLTIDFKVPHQSTFRASYKIKSEAEKERLTNQLLVGMTCQVTGTLKKPDPPSNFNAFDYPSYLKHHGIDFLLDITEINHCVDRNPSIISQMKRIRQNGILFVNQRFPKKLAGISNALVFGDRSYMDPDVLQAYQTLGLIHLLAVSGLHVGIVMALCDVLLLRLGMVKEHVHLFLLVVLIPLYAVLTGLSPSVLRASLMIGLALLSTFLKFKPPPMSILAYACMILLIVNPDVLFDIGFQLSFLIAFAIIISAPTIQKRHKNAFVRTFVMTGIAQTAALPIILYNFYSISLLSFILNLFFIPFISVIILPLSIMTVSVMLLFPTLAHLFIVILSWLVIPAHDLLLKCQEFFIFNVVTGRPSQIGMFALVTSVLAVLVLWEKWNRKWSAFLPLGLILSVGITHHAIQRADPYGAVTFLDVGQGDSILIQLPHDEGVMLIDTGGHLPFPQADWQKRRDPYDVGKDVVAQAIKAQGIAKINWLVLTHRDMDHIGGLNGLIGRTPIDTIIISQVFQASETETAWFKRAESLGIQIKRVPSGSTWGNAPLYLKALWPTEFQPTSNNRSLVLFARLGGVNWLFTGDLEKDGEKGLLELHPNLHIDILKAGHHGSHTSSSPVFIQTIKPKLAVISVGKNNRFGHPHADVLKTYQDNHVPILRTDEDGAIKIIYTKDHIISIQKAKN